MVLLEAMYLGLAVVAAPVGGIPEVIADGVSGCLLPANHAETLADACGRLFENPDLRGELGRKAQERIRDSFSAAQNARVVLEMYRQVVGAAAHSGPEGNRERWK